MRVRPLGERAVIVDELEAPAWQYLRHLRHAAGTVTEDIAVTPTALGLYFAGPVPSELPEEWFRAEPSGGRHYRIPVDYSRGEDLAEVARETGLTPRQVVTFHTERAYVCESVGFQPGFGYLQGLPVELLMLPRRATPRARVPAGAVALAAGMTAVYPHEGPGGWNLIGLTRVQMFAEDQLESPGFSLEPGDRITFFADPDHAPGNLTDYALD